MIFNVCTRHKHTQVYLISLFHARWFVAQKASYQWAVIGGSDNKYLTNELVKLPEEMDFLYASLYLAYYKQRVWKYILVCIYPYVRQL